jgi:FMN-dependent NADH-azoreductase
MFNVKYKARLKSYIDKIFMVSEHLSYFISQGYHLITAH